LNFFIFTEIVEKLTCQTVLTFASKADLTRKPALKWKSYDYRLRYVKGLTRFCGSWPAQKSFGQKYWKICHDDGEIEKMTALMVFQFYGHQKVFSVQSSSVELFMDS